MGGAENDDRAPLPSDWDKSVRGDMPAMVNQKEHFPSATEAATRTNISCRSSPGSNIHKTFADMSLGQPILMGGSVGVGTGSFPAKTTTAADSTRPNAEPEVPEKMTQDSEVTGTRGLQRSADDPIPTTPESRRNLGGGCHPSERAAQHAWLMQSPRSIQPVGFMHPYYYGTASMGPRKSTMTTAASAEKVDVLHQTARSREEPRELKTKTQDLSEAHKPAAETKDDLARRMEAQEAELERQICEMEEAENRRAQEEAAYKAKLDMERCRREKAAKEEAWRRALQLDEELKRYEQDEERQELKRGLRSREEQLPMRTPRRPMELAGSRSKLES